MGDNKIKCMLLKKTIQCYRLNYETLFFYFALFPNYLGSANIDL